MAKNKRRGNGEGSIFQRSDGLWTATITVGYADNGKRKRRAVYGKTKREVQDKLTRMQHQKMDGVLSESDVQTVAVFLDNWLENCVRVNNAGTTYLRCKTIVNKHLIPFIGGIRLNRLAPDHLQAMLATMERSGVSASNREYSYSVLRRALNVAVKWGKLIRNVCGRIDPPKVKRRDISPLTVKESQRLFDVAESDRLYAVIVLAVMTGMRQGELFALTWEDIDLDNGVIFVRHTLQETAGKLTVKEPKSASGKRRIVLPAVAVDVLWKHRTKMMAEGLAAVSIAFCDHCGGYLRKSNFRRRTWEPIRKAAEIPKSVRFHDLRHTQASQLLSQGVHPKVVQERLGHSKISLTLDTYSHLLPGIQETAVDQLNLIYKIKRA